MNETSQTASPLPIARSLFVLTLLYGGMTVIAGVLAFKQFAVGPIVVESGILAFLLLVVISSVIAQLHGKRVADRLVLWGFLPLAFSIALIFIVLALPPSPDMPPENLAAFNLVNGQTPRIMAAGPVAYGVSLLLNVWIFDKLRGKKRDGGLGLMARGAIASAISQAVDSLIFITLAFYGEFPIGPLLVGQAIAKVVLSFVLVPFLILGALAIARRLDGEQRAERQGLTDTDALIAAALAARQRAHAPYSNFLVGCAIEGANGQVAVGANMENACYRLGVCAEQAALAAALQVFGLDQVRRVVVVGGPRDAGDADGGAVTPCGGCRQAIAEAAALSGCEIVITCCDHRGRNAIEATIGELLPASFALPD